MAASEPPEPPPRNPETLKQFSQGFQGDNSSKLPADAVTLKEDGRPNSSEASTEPAKVSLNMDSGTSKCNGKGLTSGSDTEEQIVKLLQKATLDDELDELVSPQSSKSEFGRQKRLQSPDEAIGGTISDSNSGEDNMDRLKVELKMARAQITQLRNERKKLRSEKLDLLSHVKQLCNSLQDKEQELRDFIRNYEMMREAETNDKTNSDLEQERWSLKKKAREESERSMKLAAQLNATQEQLLEARRQLADQENVGSFMMNMGSNGTDHMRLGSAGEGTSSADLNISDGPYDNGICITMDPDSISIVSNQQPLSQYANQLNSRERSPTLSPLNTFARSTDRNNVPSRYIDQLGATDTDRASGGEGNFLARKMNKHSSTLGRATSRGGTWGSISKVFARSKNRSRNSGAQHSDTESVQDFQWNPLNEDGYAEKLRQLREASAIPMDRWRASQVLAWLEVILGMPQYSSRCAENVKSGKVLLELSDQELDSGLGLTHPMHRKKLRLAIEEHRRPDLVRYATIGQLGHTWVASEWLPDIGLPQYIDSFMQSYVDARMLDTLSKKELEKMLGVTRKFHQASIVHGIHVLRIMKYDRQELAMRRHQSDGDTDPIVWTNQRFVQWIRSIDLGEYADNLKDSGVHGGLVVLEPSFSGETMATALGIPPNKNIIRRHLAAEFDNLVVPARYILFCDVDDIGPPPIAAYSNNTNIPF